MKIVAALFSALICLLVIPIDVASAATFTVTSVDDEPDAGGLDGTCLTAGLKCTLRAAIEESNSSTGVTDTIVFATNPFDGQAADTIAIAAGLPTIVDPVHIDGDSAGQCTTEAGPPGPCVGIDGPPVGSALLIEADGVTISGLAITGAAGSAASAGIEVNGSEGLVARDDWLGVKLNGAAEGNSRGIFIGPDSNGATIGGVDAGDRNVIADSSRDGLDIAGADDTTVLGNYFGVGPDGATLAANGESDIQVTDTTTLEASGTEIGTTVEGAAATSAECDGGCNVISGSLFGINLHGGAPGERPASGPTSVRGNFVGLDAEGEIASGSQTYGVFAGKTKAATIGGEAQGDANFIAGGEVGIRGGNGEGFAAVGNSVGINPVGAPVPPPSEAGIELYSEQAIDEPVVEGNTIRMVSGTGIWQSIAKAKIVENDVEGGAVGIDSGGLGSLISGNVVNGAESIGISIEGNSKELLGNAIIEPGSNGILIEGNSNQILGNEVVSSGEASIKIHRSGGTSPTLGNVVGGEDGQAENLIFASDGAAIEIVDLEDSQNEIARNRGNGNSGPFIELRATNAALDIFGPNGAIQPPIVSAARESEASGSSEPHATIRVFRKSAAEPGELQSFVTKAVASSSGLWKVTYPTSMPPGTIVAFTQTNIEGGTSELSTVVTEAPPQSRRESGAAKPVASNDLPPETRISSGPPRKTHKRTVKFAFNSNAQSARFQCKLDRKPFSACHSPKRYTSLKPGRHVFQVRAIDAAGNIDGSPAKRKFEVLR